MFHLIRAGSTYEIWSVRPMAENTAYAMKWLPPGERHTRTAVNDLRQEFTVGQDLDHSNVIKTFDFGTSKDGAYLIMELYRYPNLKQRIHAGTNKLHYHLPMLISGMAAGLSHLHENGWVHRDVKPDNFLVGDDYDVRLIDFNLARRKQSGLGKLFSGKSKIQGTQSYIPPEQIRGKSADQRADIYSFGCVIYEMVHGKPPFTAVNSNELLNKHLRAKPPALSVVNTDIHPDFSARIQQMMSKSPSDRPESLEDLTHDLKLHHVFRVQPKEVVEE